MTDTKIDTSRIRERVNMTIETKKVDSLRLKAISRFHVADEADIADRKVALTVAHRHRGELLAHIAYLEQRLAAIEKLAQGQREAVRAVNEREHITEEDVLRCASYFDDLHALILDHKEPTWTTTNAGSPYARSCARHLYCLEWRSVK